MTTLRIGYNLFKGASQSGSGSFGGTIQVETAKAKKYYLQVKRLSDDYYWNDTTGTFVTPAPAEANMILIPGSDEANPDLYRRLECHLPELCRAGITSAGVTFTAYATGDTPSSAGIDLTLEYAP